MDDLTDKVASRITAARQNAEALMKPTSTPTANLKLQQEREWAAMAAKTAHLRELRLAKEAAENEAAGPVRARKPKGKRRRVRSF